MSEKDNALAEEAKTEKIVLTLNDEAETEEKEEVTAEEISKVDLRENYIVTQGVVIQALGQVGTYFYKNPDADMERMLKRLKNIDWKRSASIWRYRVIRADGKILTSNKAILLTANQIKKELGIPLLPDEELKEKRYLESLNV